MNNKIKQIIILISLMLSISSITITGTAINNIKTLNLDCSQVVNNPLLLTTFLGGENKDGMYYTGINIVQDSQGNIIIAGTTESSDFPVTNGAYSQNHNGNTEIFITKMNPDLTNILSSTFIGGAGNEEARGITIDSQGNIFVSGITESSDFPVSSNAFQNQYGGGTDSPYGSGDAFIIKLTNDLTNLISATFLGGSGHESCSCIAIDLEGNIVISGSTSSTNFPVSDNAFDKTYEQGGFIKDDIFITKLSDDLTEMIASTYISGRHDDFCEALSIDSSNNIIITGWTRSSDYPSTQGAYDTKFAYGYYDGFISKLNTDLSSMISSTFIGGSQWDFCYGLTLDDNDNIYVTGHTASQNYPTSSNAYCKNYQGIGGPNKGDDAFISKLSNNLSILLASTYLGGSQWENGFSLAVSNSEIIYVAGCTSSPDFPTINSFSDTFQGGTTHWGEIFISCFTNDLSLLPASTYLGGIGDEDAGQVLIDINGEIIVAGATSSNDFPIIGNGYDLSFNGNADVFISKFKTGLTNNTAPDKPEITGPTSGKPKESYEYVIKTEDVDANKVYFFIDWGDDINSGWIGRYDSDEPCSISHSWASKGNYEIKVKAKDIFGFESEWTSLEINMPKNYCSNLFQNLLNRIVTKLSILTNTLEFQNEKKIFNK
jgi:beta-propeller repeat-containing protein